MIIVRDARVEDLPAMLDIYNWAVVNSTATFDLEVQTLEQRMEWFKKYGGRYPLIVAEEDGQVMGYSCLSRFREKEAYARTVESSVYIGKDFWGKGVGKLLMNEILKRAAELGHHAVIAGITTGNDASVKLHVQLGFEPIGRFKEVGHKFGEWQDVTFYELILP